MFQSIGNDVRNAFRYNNSMLILIIWNVGVFLLLLAIRLILMMSGKEPVFFDTYIGKWIEFPMNALRLIKVPYAIITYQFIHYSPFHLLFNMLVLYWFAQILENVLTNKYTIALYISGGIVGALLALFFYSVVPNLNAAHSLLGASAGIAAILAAAATISPHAEIHLLFIGRIEVRFVALFFIIINLAAVAAFNNVGGSIAHLGGVVWGYLFVKQIQQGTDLTSPIQWIMQWPKRNKKQNKNTVQNNSSTWAKPANNATQKKLDAILDKIHISGYDSLSKEEKDFLFTYSKDK